MKLISQRIRGMQDVLFSDGQRWNALCNLMQKEAQVYGFQYARTPAVEHTELFERSSGDSSDIVNKEMYTFEDKSGRKVSLRPEGTAGIMRAVLESGVSNHALPMKLMYNASCYRYEKPQSGRYREFFQFGLEIFGSSSILAEVQLIKVAKRIIEKIGINNVSLEINSIGCSECRKNYIDMLKKYFYENKEKLCKTCISRLEKNPLRIFDCKEVSCKNICDKAPLITEHLCKECEDHFSALKKKLDLINIDYTVNPRIVRGLDYYTGTVFEFITNISDTSLTVCGGGRYDKLSEILGGSFLPAVGLGFGIERLIMAIDEQGLNLKFTDHPLIYIASMDEKSATFAEDLCEKLRKVSIYVENDISERSLKAQIKHASKIGSEFLIVLGEEEINSGMAKIRNMNNAEEKTISIGADFLTEIYSLKSKNSFV